MSTDGAASAISAKTLVMIVGPTAVGKSTIMNHAVKLDNRFKRVGGFTTRPPRSDDEPGLYRYPSLDEVYREQDEGTILQYITNPANGHVYGTSVYDYPGEYNLKDTLSNAVDDFKRLPFMAIHTVSVSGTTDAWRDWLTTRYPQPSTERTMRLKEAKRSIEWSLAQTTNHHWLINRPNAANEAAQELIDLILRPHETMLNPPDEPRKMLELIDDLLSLH